jgi:type I restriction enzyme R subunit/putative DNA methylase
MQGEENKGLQRTMYQLRSAGIPAETQNKLRTGIHNRGYLPHVKVENASYFVTFRLADSLPKEVLLRFEQEHAAALRQLTPGADRAEEEINRDLRRKIERYLDLGKGECWLRKPEIAGLMVEALQYFNEKHYRLDSWVVMPNHIHLILWPLPNHTLSEILKSRKQKTARQANLLLGRTGETFW